MYKRKDFYFYFFLHEKLNAMTRKEKRWCQEVLACSNIWVEGTGIASLAGTALLEEHQAEV